MIEIKGSNYGVVETSIGIWSHAAEMAGIDYSATEEVHAMTGTGIVIA